MNRNSGHQEPGVFPIGATEGADETRFLPDNAFAGGDDPLAGFVAASAGARAADTAAAPPAPRRRRRVLLPVLTILCLLAGLGLTGWGAMLALRPSAAGSAEPSPIAPMTSQLADPAATPAPAVTAPAATEPAGTGTAVPGASPGGVPAIAGDVTSAESITVMVNKRTPLTPQDHVPGDLVPMSSIGVPSANDHSLRAEAAEAVSRMFQAAAAEGYALDMTSGYRSYASQAELYDGYVASLGQEAADATSARPGYSEHQTGLAADISAPSAGCVLEQCFAQTAEGQWLAENAWQYGFILRYPEGMTSVTGYEFEPWHYRFVGTEVATAMRDGGYASYEHFLGYPAAPGYEG